MACTHTADCPLFPKLHASLEAWRENYCDTETRWTTCARYERTLRGEPVPIALLPNGKIIGMVAEHEHDGEVPASAPAAATGEGPTVIKASLWQRLFGKGK